MFIDKGISEMFLSNEVIQSVDELRKLRQRVKEYVSGKKLVPPLQQEDVLRFSGEFIAKYAEYKQFQKLIAVIINNNAWMPFVEKIPYNKRILLLPKCLRHSAKCPAKIDELGLICESCGSCLIDEIINAADKLGYHSIVSEGTGAVSMLLSSGQVECVIGVGCLDSLEQTFPLALKHAIPSIGIPLFDSQCKDSRVDSEWIYEILNQRNEKEDNKLLNIEAVRKEVQSWFTSEKLIEVFGNKNETVTIANKWLEAGGKRWRPLIMASLYKAMNGLVPDNNELLIKLAISVECFHKASLAHDDIADDDPERYGKPTLHEEYDTSVALNTGDLLMGYGYQLIAQSGLKPDQVSQLLSVASKGHRDLCLGQGQELILRRNGNILSANETLDIFSNKTAPAFEVALKFGAIAVKTNNGLLHILGDYSRALGIAYQIQDDLEDFNQVNSTNDINSLRPSLILALLGEKYPQKMKSFIQRYQKKDITVAPEIYVWAKNEGIITEAQKILLKYKQQALSVLNKLDDSNIKILLYRLLNKIIRDVSVS